MEHVTRYCDVITDNTGVAIHVPVIFTEYGPMFSLVSYFKENHVKSKSWMAKVAQGVGLLLDYMAANHDTFDNPEELFGSFVMRLYSGTVGLNGIDPSGLYWLGRDSHLVRPLVNRLSAFSEWLVLKGIAKQPLNPWRAATGAEEMVKWAAWHHAKTQAFLGHTWRRDLAALEMSRARKVILQTTPIVDRDQKKSFPKGRIGDLLFRGFIVPGKQKSPRAEERLNLRDILITMLMEYGGLRVSEPFHLYVQDVSPDPLMPSRALVRVYHPTEGQAPRDWLDATGKPVNCNRGSYLRGKFGMEPRTDYPDTSQLHAGWKGNLLDDQRKFMDVNWFPSGAGELFWKLWIPYMIQRARLSCDHPFAFVTLNGEPYAIDTFDEQHSRAVERIGLIPAKALGTTNHGHRHAYAQRLADADVHPIHQKKALHHKSLKSQEVYTEPDRLKLSRIIEAASQNFEKNEMPALQAYGINDPDSLASFVGKSGRYLERGRIGK